MANALAPFGLKSMTRLDGGTIGRVNGGYAIADQYASALAQGDLVVLAATTNTFQNNAPNIALGATGNTFRGVFAGCAYQDSLGNFIWSKNWIASTVTLNAQGAQAFVYDDPQIIFQIQYNNGGALLTSAQASQFVPIAYGAGNALGISQTTAGAPSATITDLKIVRVAPLPGNVIANPYPILEVLIAKHDLRDPISNN